MLLTVRLALSTVNTRIFPSWVQTLFTESCLTSSLTSCCLFDVKLSRIMKIFLAVFIKSFRALYTCWRSLYLTNMTMIGLGVDLCESEELSTRGLGWIIWLLSMMCGGIPSFSLLLMTSMTMLSVTVFSFALSGIPYIRKQLRRLYCSASSFTISSFLTILFRWLIFFFSSDCISFSPGPPPPTQCYLGYALCSYPLFESTPYLRTANISKPTFCGLFAGFSRAFRWLFLPWRPP